MVDDSVSFDYGLITILTMVLSGTMLFYRFHRRVLLTAVGGFHASNFALMGIGALFYSRYDYVELVSQKEIMASFVRVGWYWLAGYFLWCVIEWRTMPRAVVSFIAIYKHTSIVPPLVLLALSFIGYIFSQYEIAISGVGTIFVVLKGFLYPSVILIALSIHMNKPTSIVPATIGLLVAIYFALFSPWRSELVFMTGAIGLGLVSRNRRWILPFVIIGIVGLLVIVPFVNYKRTHYIETLENPFKVFLGTLDLSFNERLDGVGRFFGIRSNAAREMAFVQHGIEHSLIEYRDGETYSEALQQAIPRVVWPDKPSFNYLTAFALPRRIGMLARDDLYTSWGVSLWAELLWNFTPVNLLWFVPSVFCLMQGIDYLTRRLFKRSMFIFLVQATLFFLLLQIVGIGTIVTCLIWTILTLKGGEIVYSFFVPMEQELSKGKPSESPPTEMEPLTQI